ncbi:YkoP family protein [Shouchella clausii]|uniref:YkoP family protein n=1 Tax=Shouchella clausii TaxID=79880 RepID=UPI0021477F5C|nr:hypothetical protein [Shouchella clausii]MCR1286804.1 hypothetical protein [Shouchella clausii]
MKLKLYFLSAWSVLDPIYFYISRLHYPENAKTNTTIFRIKQIRYKGPKVCLADGQEICKNDVLIKIHLHNVRLIRELFAIDNDLKKATVLVQKVKESMPPLAFYIERQANAEDIKGIIGVTMLNRGCERLGFEAHPIRNRFYKGLKRLSQHPIFLLSMSKFPTKSRKTPSPMYVFLSKQRLLEKYGPKLVQS